MKKIETIQITRQQSYALSAQMILFLFIGAAIFQGIVGETSQSFGFEALAVYLITLVIHELLHGLGFLLGGAWPRFGIGIAGIIPVAYATSDQKLPVKNMLLVAYLPFVVLSVVFIVLSILFPAYQNLFMIGFLGNFAGAVGDIWIASKLWKYLKFKDVLILDTKIGTEVFSSNATAAKTGRESTEKSKQRSSFMITALIGAGVIIMVQAIIPLVMVSSGFEGSYQLGSDNFYLFKVSTESAVRSAELNILPALIGGVIVGITYVLRNAVGHRMHVP
ncbi:DUF3267 domain-containing protein [Candidatus Saccharibacteria bacterium]|nr:MAG: DUF3267 domain-containing protein [Candidatus Saccharibacteria bacterium]